MQANPMKHNTGIRYVINRIGSLILRPLIVVGLASVLAVLHLPHPTRMWEQGRSRFREWVQQMG